jgi:hypothetical protein
VSIRNAQRFLFGLAVVIASVCCAVALAQPPRLPIPGDVAVLLLGRGVVSGRATAADALTLQRDFEKVIRAERAFNLVQRDGAESVLLTERQKRLLGATGDLPQGSEQLETEADLALASRNWWVKHVLQPALDVAANPAAGCDVAIGMLQRILELEKQAQIIGLEGARFGDFGDSDSIIGRALRIVQRRCLVEAYDECLDTGNGRVFGDVIRQLEFLPNADLQAHAEYLLERCTVYSVTYHLELDDTIADNRRSIVADGSYRLLFSAEGDGPITRLSRGSSWAGPREQDRRSSNVVLTSASCGRAAVSCELEESPVDGLARLRLSQKHRPTETRVLLVQETLVDRAYGGRVVVEWLRCDGAGGRTWVRAPPPREARCTEGEDSGAMEFEPPSFEYLAEYRPNYGPLTGVGPNDSIFYMATQSGGDALYTVDQWERVGHPLLFTATIERTGTGMGLRGGFRSHVRGAFSLTHRPDLFPPDRIKPEYELSRNETPERPPRLPLRAR